MHPFSLFFSLWTRSFLVLFFSFFFTPSLAFATPPQKDPHSVSTSSRFDSSWETRPPRSFRLSIALASEKETLPSLRLAQDNPKTNIDPPLKGETIQDADPAPPSEWALALFQGFSGVIVAVVASFAIQSLFEAVIVSTNPTIERQTIASFAYTGTNLVVIPWIVAGTIFGLGRLSNNYSVSFWWVLLGAYAGQLLSSGIGLLATFASGENNRFAVARIITLFSDGLLTAGGALLFYLLFRKAHTDIQAFGSLFSHHDGHWRIGIPLPRIQHSDEGIACSLPLLSGSF
jgi:hypothetical protein